MLLNYWPLTTYYCDINGSQKRIRLTISARKHYWLGLIAESETKRSDQNDSLHHHHITLSPMPLAEYKQALM